MSKLTATTDYSSEQYEYSTKKGFFEYAFPEVSSSQRNISTTFQDLYDAGYNIGLIDQLVGNLRQKLEKAKKLPANTKIFLFNTCLDISKLSEFLNDKILGQDFSSSQKIVFILPLSIENHAHSLVIHLEYTQEGLIVHTIFKDPYGKDSAFDSKINTVIDQVKIFAQNFFENRIKTFKHKSDAIDLQGFNYDFNNCAPITIYCLEKFLTRALTDSKPDEYEISLSFDMFSDPKMNIEVHNAFVLRQKLEQLLSVKEDYELGFKSAKATNFEDATKSAAAKESINDLSQKIFKSATDKYIEQKFITADKFDKLSNLDEARQIKLLNSISLYIVEIASSNIINPSKLSEAIGRIIDNFDSEPKPTTQQHRELIQSYCNNADDILNFFLFGILPRFVGSVESELIKSVQKNDFESYQSYVKSRTAEQIEKEINAHDMLGKTAIMYAIEFGNISIVGDLCIKGANILTSPNNSGVSALQFAAENAQNIEILEILLGTLAVRTDYFNILTELLQFLASKWSRDNDFLTHDLEKNTDIRCQILDKLLSKGADPFVIPILIFLKDRCVPLPSAMKNIANSKPSLAQTFLKYYPEKIVSVFLEAASVNNIELVNYLRDKITDKEFSDNDDQLKSLFFAALEGSYLDIVKYCINQNKFDEDTLEKALKKVLELSKDLEKRENELNAPFVNDPEAVKKIRTTKPKLNEIKQLIESTKGALIEPEGHIAKKQKPAEITQKFGKLRTSIYSIIIKSAKNDNFRLMKLNLDMSPVKLNIDMFDEDGYNALLYATKNKSCDVIKYLLDIGANINICTTRLGIQAVFKEAISNNDIQVLNLLIEFAKKYSSGIDISDLLYYAINCHASKAVEHLINLDSVAPSIIQKAINDAIQINMIDILEILLTKVDSDILHTNYEITKWPPLEFAVIMKNIEAVDLLIKAGADVNKRIVESPVKLACSTRCDIKILQKLLASGASVNNLPLKDCEKNPLIYSMLQKNFTATKLLLEHGANPNETAPDGRTALDIASRYSSQNCSTESLSREELFALLVKHGANTYNSRLNGSYLSNPSLIEQYFKQIDQPLHDLATPIASVSSVFTSAVQDDVTAPNVLVGDQDSHIDGD